MCRKQNKVVKSFGKLADLLGNEDRGENGVLCPLCRKSDLDRLPIQSKMLIAGADDLEEADSLAWLSYSI
jgi:hypothetical protein